ncbi:hypothetical protein BpHYR1_031704 [Brachionus plicatilis]|uniref:Uncharacterized protein n=1 Tax=Brachionus plicatilis TaxID=10195 RepID=A0A3M7QNP4_BRAPC|nr:hypothetical protein BpHYR1_031704 [Brachionus plicatilis]
MVAFEKKINSKQIFKYINMFLKVRFLKNAILFFVSIYLIIELNKLIYSIIIHLKNKAYLNSNFHRFLNNSKFLSFDNHDPLQKFKSNHEAIINLASQSINKKVVFHKRLNSGGYGNSLYSMLSALLIAIISESALISDWEYIEYFVVPPLKNVFHKYEPTSELNINFKTNYLLSTSKNAWIYDKNVDIYLENSLPRDQNRIQFESLSAYFFDVCAQPQNFDKLLEYKLASNKTIERANISVSQRKTGKQSDAQIVEDLLLVGFEVGSVLINKFWKPQTFLTDQINSFYDREFRAHFVIGMQLRFLYMNKQDVDKFFKCAFYIEKINGVQKAKWFLTGDDNHRIDALYVQYPDRFIMGQGKIAHSSFSSIGSYERTILDNELLARSNEILFTGGSTYGFVAALRQNKLPYCVEGRSNKPFDENQPCKRMSLNRGPKRTYDFIVI